jgi:hypothetical protein
MASFPAPLDNLMAYVRDLRPDGGPLERLGDAVTVAQEVIEQADALIGYFVDRARASGASWSQIGGAMGVTKQAAQKRFVLRDDGVIPEGKTFSRFAPRARSAIAASGQLAAIAGAENVDVAHLAGGLLQESEGLAARAVHRLEVEDRAVYDKLGVGPAPGGYDSDPTALRQLRFSPAGRRVLREALTAALRYGHNYIGTEHLLIGVTVAGGDVADRLAALGLSSALVQRALDVELAEVRLERERQAE